MEKTPLSQPDAVLFDAYGDGLLAEPLFNGKGEALPLPWRDKQIAYTRLASTSGRYRPFCDLNRAGGPLEQLDTLPTRTGSSLRDVLDFSPSA